MASVEGYAAAVHAATGTLHRSQNPNAVATSSLQTSCLVHDLGKSIFAGRHHLVVLSAVESHKCRWCRRSWWTVVPKHATCFAAPHWPRENFTDGHFLDARPQDWRALLCNLHSGGSLTIVKCICELALQWLNFVQPHQVLHFANVDHVACVHVVGPAASMLAVATNDLHASVGGDHVACFSLETKELLARWCRSGEERA